MSDRFLVLGDHHGDTESLRRVLADTEGETFDFAVHVGDLTNAYREDRAVAAEQLREVEPLLAELADRIRHDLVWVYGNRDYFGDIPYDLDVGTRVPEEGCVSVGGQRFTNSPAAVESDVVLVTHMETWSLLDHFEGRAHFCGNTHDGRYLDRRLNSAFLQYTYPESGEQLFGGYFVVDVSENPSFEVDVRPIGDLERLDCERHAERGVQFQPSSGKCMYCRDHRVLMREMAASAFYGVTSDSGAESAAADTLVEYAMKLWEDPPSKFSRDFRQYLATLEYDRYAPLERIDDGCIVVSDPSYAY